MLLSEREDCHYDHRSVNEVICQLRFPTILAIDKDEPAAFQDAIRADFPRYAVQQETAPKAPDGTQPSAITNYSFLSADNLWKINLTRGFLALSTLQYTDWASFAHLLDRSLVQFIRLYEPAFFERIGLRYVNIFSRSKLGLDGVPFSELFSPAYLGPLSQKDVREENLIKCAIDLDLKLDSSCTAKIHAGPGRLKSNAPNT
ncbi:MAG: TIGR04255 family protein, partial [Ruthenibacterium sp.]